MNSKTTSKMLKQLKAGLTFLMVCQLFAPTLAARADEEHYIDHFPGGVKIVVNAFDPRTQQTNHKTVFEDQDLLNAAVNQAWNEVGKGIANQQLEKEIGGRKLADGVGIYNEKSDMASLNELRAIDQGNNTIGLKYLFRNNSLSFKVTTPTVLGSYADPAFKVNYDLELKLTMTVPPSGQPITVNQVTYKIENPHLDSDNFPGDLAKIASSVSDFFGGPDFLHNAESKLNQSGDLTKAINNTLQNSAIDALNKAMQTIQGTSSQGLLHLTASIPDDREVLISADLNAPDAVFQGPGSISGAIRWNKSDGHPVANDCNALDIAADAQNAPQQPGTFEPPAKRLGQITNLTFAEVGDQDECRYTLSGLPLEIPMNLTVSPKQNYTWEGNAAYMDKRFTRSNWDGKITLKPRVWNHRVEQGESRSSNSSAPITSRAVTAVASSHSGLNSAYDVVRDRRVQHDPTGILSVSDINFDMSLVAPPR
jgi:hypothetical protein